MHYTRRAASTQSPASQEVYQVVHYNSCTLLAPQQSWYHTFLESERTL